MAEKKKEEDNSKRYKVALASILIIIFLILFFITYNNTTTQPLMGTNCFSISYNMSCTKYILNIRSNLSFSLTSYANRTFYNLQVACIAAPVINNSLETPTYFYSSVLSNKTLSKNNVIYVNGLPCYMANGSVFIAHNPGARYNGFIFIKYTNSSAFPSFKNQYNFLKEFEINTYTT